MPAQVWWGAEMADTAGTENRAGRPDPLLSLMMLLGALGVFAAIAFLTLNQAPLSADEANAIVRSLWYAGPANVPHVAPYTATDATGQMPLYLHGLGYWQRLEGIGPFPARLLSVGLGLVNAALLFFVTRRLTANTLAAAAAVLILLATPATAYAFATATPAALTSALLLLAMWLIVGFMGRGNFAASALMGAVCAVLYFTRQNTLLAIAALVPLYIAASGRKRAANAAVLVVAAAAVTAAILYAFPAKLGDYALRLPVISPLLEKVGLLAPNFVIIDHGSSGAVSMAPAFGRFSAAELFDTFLLPYAGTIILALALFKLAGGPLKILWIAPLLFLGLGLAHYLAALGYCQGCMAGYAPSFSAFGALAAALALAMFAHRARLNGFPAAPSIMVGALLAVALNAFAPLAALTPANKGAPITRIASPTPELRDIETVARWVAANVPPKEPVLVLHGLGTAKVPSLPYAVLLSDHAMPAQSIDPLASRRTVNTTLSAAGREAVQAALEEESLWSDATLARWIDRDFDFIVFQEDRTINQRAQIGAISQRFDLAATTAYRGSTLYLYKRKAGQ